MSQVIITTKYIIKDKKDILTVIHDEEGDWQFLGEEEITEEDALVISLDQILKHDLTLKQIVGIPKGTIAVRTSITANWELKDIN